MWVSRIRGTQCGKAGFSVFDTANPGDVMWKITSENGRFEFDSLKPGKFSLQGAKRGFIRAAYEQHEQFSSAIVSGAEFDTDYLVLRLTTLALLGGKVIIDWVDPVSNARVLLYLQYLQAVSIRSTSANTD